MTLAIVLPGAVPGGGPPAPGGNGGPAAAVEPRAAGQAGAGAEAAGVLDRIRAQLTAAGITEVRHCADLAALAALARAGRGPLLLCTDELVAHPSVLRNLATEPGGGTVALTAGGPPAAPGHAGIREERGQVVAADTPTPPGATGRFLGALRVGPGDRARLAEVAERLAAARPAAAPAALGPTPAAGRTAADPPGDGGALDRLVCALAADGLRIGSSRVRLLVAERPTDAVALAETLARLRSVDEEAARLRLAVKERDDFFTTFFVSSYSPRVVRWADRLRLSPTGVTGLSVVLAAVAAAGFATGARVAMVAGALLLYLSFVLDCVDGQLARYQRDFSPFGGWLDTMADRAKEYLAYAGLAAGAAQWGHPEGWLLALGAMTLQTARHMTDTWYGLLHDTAVARRAAPAAPARAAADGAAMDGGGVGGRLGRLSERVQGEAGSAAYWLKRILVFPIGERWALVAVTVAVAGPRAALWAVLGAGSFAAAYTLALRGLRARTMRASVLDTVDTRGQRDDGPLARLLSRAVGAAVAPLPAAGLAALAAAGYAGAQLTGRAAAPAAWTVGAAAAVLLAGAAGARPHTGALDWLVPAALRAAEYLFVAGVGLAYGVPVPLTFVLVFALALRHYDLTTRVEKRTRGAGRRRWDVGYDGRVAVLAVGALLGAAAPVTAALAGYAAAVFVAGLGRR
ncbi:MAG TPA: DUF5941 domain-containing protein [Pilimelia sp.]|nr:DUF5941 domain-containing protein [Pilimelia sp.]